MQNIKQKWISLNEEYDSLILRILNGEGVDTRNVKDMQKELFALETEIFSKNK